MTAGNLITDFRDGLYLIDLPQPMPGFRRFISSWFFKDAAGRRVVVDPGPMDTVPLLIRELETLTDGVDVILITHIHLDHAGGLGAFCRHYPNAAVLAHDRAFRHLRWPRKLWNASVRTLGGVALMYGEPEPLSESTPLYEEDDMGIIEVFKTPGHAPHHLCFRVQSQQNRTLFLAGEAAGMAMPAEDGGVWLRPTTPPHFDAEAGLKSMELILSVLHGGETLCYAHWGMSEDAVERVSMALTQTREWLDAVNRMRDKGPEEIVSALMTRDPLLKASMAPDLLERERLFMSNSVRGMLEFCNAVEAATAQAAAATPMARTATEARLRSGFWRRITSLTCRSSSRTRP